MQVVRQGGLWCRASQAAPRDAEEERRALARKTMAHLRVGMPGANIIGAAVVFAYYGFAIGLFKQDADSMLLNLAVALGFFPVVTVWASHCAMKAMPTLKRWRDGPYEDREPTDAERAEMLAVPKKMVMISLINWLLGIPVFFTINLIQHDLHDAIEVAGGIALAGAAVCATVYLLAEKIMRPVVAKVLAPDAPPAGGSLGIEARFLGTWALLAGVPLLAIASIPIGPEIDQASDVVAPIWFVVITALIAGALSMKLAAQAVARPVRDLRRAMDDVGEGRTDVRVTVTDASEVGRLQAGFNRMVQELGERELLRDLFGRQVGDDVAREALERGVTLGGQTRTVTTLFVDVIGSTSLAARERPERVVAILNQFFAAVVEVVGKHGGLVNKFEGDGAMCVFGAPVEHDDHATAGLAAARELSRRLGEVRRSGVPLEAAIGVSTGTAVAGHIGAEERYEYTVIGDPVNEAARLRDLAKSRPGKLVASNATVSAASAAEAAHWVSDGEARLRGRGAATGLAIPAVRDETRMSVA